jgi:hypothetical protein
MHRPCKLMYAGIQDLYGRESHMMLACTCKWEWDMLGTSSSPACSTHNVFTCKLSTYCQIMFTGGVSCTLVVLPCIYVFTLQNFFWSSGPIYICTSNRPKVVDLVMNRMFGDESRHAARTLFADLINGQEIWHPNHYCWSILLSLLDVMAILEFSSLSPISVATPYPHLVSRLHCTNIYAAICFPMEAEEMARTESQQRKAGSTTEHK